VWLGIKQQSFLCLIIAALIITCILSAQYVKPVDSCFGPCITADIDQTQVFVNQTVTVRGTVCPPEENKTVRVAFTRPDYTYIDRIVLTNPKTGNYSVTQVLDQVGYWNIFPIDGHIANRLYAEVTDPNNPAAPIPTPSIPSVYKPNYNIITASIILLVVGGIALFFGTRNKTRKISSIRLFVQIALMFLIFFGLFVDHFGYLSPTSELQPHEINLSTNVLGVDLPDGLPAPFFGCFYPCGRTMTCALWQIQAYIYPFFSTGLGWGVHYDSSGLARLAIVFGVIILAAVLLGRVFCGWVCPFGLYVDLVARVRKTLRIKRRILTPRLNQRFHQLSYIILALLILLSVFFASQALSASPLIAGTQKGGTVYTYYSAPFCAVCPMKPLCLLSETSIGLMKPEWVTQSTTGQFWQLGFFLTSTNLIVLAIVTAAAFFFKRSWCQICPLGALIALFNRFPPFKWISGVRLNKTEQKCTKCGICKRVCPTQVTQVYDGKSGDVATAQCIYCLRCVEMCPNEGCLQFKFAGKIICKSRNWLIKSDSIKGE
jgi:ferredoxin-type protein NapH